ncbi:MAG TPA: hypothetical protein VGL94_19695 [Ktedonobacteraceae bacterium]|jgi:hypothetical protein
MSEVALPQRGSRIGPLQIVITVLAIVTGLIHLDRGVTSGSMMGRPRGNMIPAGGPPGGGHMMGSPVMMLLPLPLPVLFYLNFIGYIVLAAALYLPALLQFQPLLRYQRVIRWLLIVYTAVTVVLWFLITGARFNLLAYIDKPLEAALIILLLVDDRQARLQRS